MRKNIKNINIGELYILFGLIGLCIVLTVFSPVFLTFGNLRNVILQMSINATVAIGMTFVILTGGIDLSVGSVVALSGVVMASTLKAGVPIIVAILVAISVGGSCGLVNGFLVTKGRMPAFIATLGMMSIARGLALSYSGGRSITGFSKNFAFLGNGTILKIPAPVLIMAGVFIFAYIILRYTRFGRYTYAIGGNKEATRLSGINVDKMLIFVYILCGVTAGIAAVMLSSRLSTSQPIAGQGYELDAIAATVIGGCSLSGGEGKIHGTFIGALIISVLRNGLNLLNVSSYAQQTAIGLVIILAVFIDRLKK